ncbi:MAG: hypothetical protein NTY36_03835, partial [Deltaproteobacteria bacterium]|nr:hypothetical protein [Deltaproteobacteria bacterium]
ADRAETSLEEHAQRSSLPPFPQKKQVDDDLGIYLPSITFLLRTVASYQPVQQSESKEILSGLRPTF